MVTNRLSFVDGSDRVMMLLVFYNSIEHSKIIS